MKLFQLALLLIFFITTAQSQNITEARRLFRHAAISEKYCAQLMNFDTNEGSEVVPVIDGYRSAATIMMAKYAWNPYNKLSYFKRGKSKLENIIHTYPDILELRFIRYGIQMNTPFFLGYRSHLQEDRSYIEKHLPGIVDVELKNMVTQYLLESKS